ncbi:MAG: hypothetical protein HYS17_06140 [Micavibrio aeruginosavorus]|uniref:DUF4154 domain-containing protein n=1 Tax=Micavibrio aeruginosavorus TaxID=349221 RepID=A0A7T5R094_9BACT|nr:MAG: hypothetical protein HYS17_06140 [Micavibrio aeruginosavorus]
MRHYIKRILSIAFAVVAALAVQVAAAQAAVTDVTLKDVQTIVRTVGFLENASNTGSVMAIIYNPNSDESLQNARQMERLLRSEKKDIEPRLVSVSNMAGIEGARFAFISSDVQNHYNSIKTALSKNKILSFTLDRACVDQNCCTIYINSKGRVEIIINKAVADDIQAKFKPVFLMMVTVI